jgi:hypothetical protein
MLHLGCTTEVGHVAGTCSRVDRTAAFEADLRSLLG